MEANQFIYVVPVLIPQPIALRNGSGGNYGGFNVTYNNQIILQRLQIGGPTQYFPHQNYVPVLPAQQGQTVYMNDPRLYSQQAYVAPGNFNYSGPYFISHPPQAQQQQQLYPVQPTYLTTSATATTMPYPQSVIQNVPPEASSGVLHDQQQHQIYSVDEFTNSQNTDLLKEDEDKDETTISDNSVISV